MKKRKLFNGVAVFIMSLSFLGNNALAQIAPKPGFPQDRYHDFVPEKIVKYGTLPNGMRYAIQRWPTPKGEIAIRMRVAGGSLHEDEKQKGLMHFLEHMAFNGSKNIKEGDLIPLLEKEGLSFGADTNAHTSYDETTYQLDMPRSNQLELGLKLMRETAGNLLLQQSAIDRERGVIESEERARNNPAYRQSMDYYKTMFDGLRFTDRAPIGDMNIVKTAQRDEFLKLYQGLYRPERTFLVVVGDVNPTEVEAKIKRYFNDWKQDGVALKDTDLGALKNNNQIVKNYVDSQLSTSITINAFRNYAEESDTSVQRRKNLLLTIARYMLNTRFSKLARKEDSPLLSASVSDYTLFHSIRAADLDINAKNMESWEGATNIAYLELKSALQYGFTDEEFKAALANMRQIYERSSAENEARRSRNIADSIISAFENDDVYTANKDDFAWYNKIEPSLNKEDALKELQEIWQPKVRNIYITTPKPIDGGNEVIKKYFDNLETIAPKPPEKEIVKAWDYTNFGKEDLKPQINYDKSINTYFVKFKNNVRLVVKNTDYEKGRIRVEVRFGEGHLALPKDKIGLSFATSSSFSAGGLGHFDIDQMQKTLAGKNIGRSFSTDEDAFSFFSTTDTNDLLLQMQIFAAYLTDPAWRLDGFNQLKAAKDTYYADEKATPEKVLGRNIGPLLTSGNIANAFPTKEQFDAIKFDDAKKVVDDARKNGSIEVVIVGDVKFTDALDAVGKTLAALPKRPDTPNPRDDARKEVFTKGRNTTILTHDGRKDQAIGAIYWPADDFGDGRQGRALNILRDMYEIKLTDIIREKEGGTYSPSVTSNFSTISPHFGYLGAVLNIKPQDVDKYLGMSEQIAADFADGKIDNALFERAKNPAIASFEVTTHNNPWWVAWLSGASFDKKRITIIKDGKAQYENVTLDEIKKLAKQYFDPKKAQIIKVLPSSLNADNSKVIADKNNSLN